MSYYGHRKCEKIGSRVFREKNHNSHIVICASLTFLMFLHSLYLLQILSIELERFLFWLELTLHVGYVGLCLNIVNKGRSRSRKTGPILDHFHISTKIQIPGSTKAGVHFRTANLDFEFNLIIMRWIDIYLFHQE